MSQSPIMDKKFNTVFQDFNGLLFCCNYLLFILKKWHVFFISSYIELERFWSKSTLNFLYWISPRDSKLCISWVTLISSVSMSGNACSAFAGVVGGSRFVGTRGNDTILKYIYDSYWIEKDCLYFWLCLFEIFLVHPFLLVVFMLSRWFTFLISIWNISIPKLFQ